MTSATPSLSRLTDRNNSVRWYATGFAAVGVIVAGRLLLHLLTANRYGIFRDELYYIACSRHLDWGYVDMPPFIPAVTWLFTTLFGSSLFVIRLIPAIAGCGAIALTGYQAFQFGGRRFAMALSALATGSFCRLRDQRPPARHKRFRGAVLDGLRFGRHSHHPDGQSEAVAMVRGAGGHRPENKYSMAVFGLGIVVGLLLTPERKAFTHKWIWIAGALAFLIFLPNLLWNVHRDWPFVQLMHNIRASGRDVALNPVQFILQQILMVNPFALPLWLAGLGWLFFGREGRRYRVLGWAYVVTLAVFMVLHGKDYYVAPAYPMLFAAGGVVCEELDRAHGGTRG